MALAIFTINGKIVEIIEENHTVKSQSMTKRLVEDAAKMNADVLLEVPPTKITDSYCSAIGSENIKDAYFQLKQIKYSAIIGVDARALLLVDCNRDILYNHGEVFKTLNESQVISTFIEPIEKGQHFVNLDIDASNKIITPDQLSYINEIKLNTQKHASYIRYLMNTWNTGNDEKERIIMELRAMWARIVDATILKHVFSTSKNTIILCGKFHADFLKTVFVHFSSKVPSETS